MCTLAAPAWAGSDATVINNNPVLTERLQAIVDDPVYKLPGLVVITVQNDEVTYTGNLGYRYIDNANPANNLPVDEFSLFRIASISKLVTAIGIMQQVEQGNIDLDADVSTYLGFTFRNPNFPTVPITVRMLMSHTASVRDSGGYTIPLGAGVLSDFFLPTGTYYNNGSHWATSSSVSDRSPGNYFTYANLNYGVLGTVLEYVTGELFDTYMRENVLQPLGIDGGWVPGLFTQWEVDNVGVLYRRSGTVWSPQVDNYGGVIPPLPAGFDTYMPGTNATWQSPLGNLRISTWDLAKIMRMFMNGGELGGVRILEPGSVDLMYAPYWTYDEALNNGNNYSGLMRSYGLGPQIMTSTGEPGYSDRILADWDIFMAGHLGEAYGLWSGMMLDRETGDGFIYYVTGRWGPVAYGEYSAFYRTEERVMTALFEEQLLPIESTSGILPPLKADGSSVFKLGGAVPLKFQLFDAGGMPYGGMHPIVSLSKLEDGDWGEEFDPVSAAAPKSSDRFRYDLLKSQYVYILDTKGMTAGTYRARIALGAGAQMYAQFSLN